MRKIIILLVFLIQLLNAYSQDDKISQIEQNPKSPEVAAFDRITDIPISEYSGNVNFSIPLYTITNGDLSVPISLDYQGSAIRVDQESTWVGLNWLLNAGGVITVRKAMHSARSGAYPGKYIKDWENLMNNTSYKTAYYTDFLVPYKVEALQPERGGFGENWFSTKKDLINDDTKESLTESKSDISSLLYTDILMYHNGEAPAYHAVFMGNSITFVYDQIKDECFETGNKKGYRIKDNIGSFKITDKNGVEYIFGEPEILMPQGQNIDNEFNVGEYSYYLTCVKSPTGRTIHFGYVDEGWYMPLRHISETLYDDKYPYQILKETKKLDVHLESAKWRYHLVRTISPYYKINKKRLYRIYSDSLMVTFNADTPREDLHVDFNRCINKLDNIEISKKEDGKMVLLKKYKFSHSYYRINTKGGNTLKDYWAQAATDPVYEEWYPNDDFMYKRLRLDKLQEIGSDGKAKPAYEFQYDTENLPCKNSAAQDYWGYYNGQENYNEAKGYHSLLPYPYGDTSDKVFSVMGMHECLSANRKSDISYATAGMLTTVRFPTGATVGFNYELNSFSNYQYLANKRIELEENYFNSYVLAQQAKTANSVHVYTTSGEYKKDPIVVYDRERSFVLAKTSIVNWRTEFVRKTAGSENVKWDDLTKCTILLQTVDTIVDPIGNPHEIISDTKVVRLNPSDTNTDSESIVYNQQLVLNSGKYKISVTRLKQDEEKNNSIKEIRSEITATSSNLTYEEYRRCLLGSLHRDEETLTKKTSSPYSNGTIKRVCVYDSNNKSYSIPGASCYNKYFLIDEPKWVEISVTHSKNGGSWKNILGHTVLLQEYGTTSMGNGYRCEYVSKTTPLHIEAEDTLKKGSLTCSKSIYLMPGRYNLCIVGKYEKNDGRYFNSTIADVTISSQKNIEESYGAGVRIASVTRSENSTERSVIKYSYVDNLNNTSGLLMSPAVFSREKLLIWQTDTTRIKERIMEYGGAPHTAKEIRYNIVSSDNISPNPSNVSYGRVVITHSCENESVKDKLVKNFHNRWTNMPDIMKKIEDPRNGFELSDSLYDAKGVLLKCSKTDYNLSLSKWRLINVVVENLYEGPNFSVGVNAIADYNPWKSAAGGGVMETYMYPSVQFHLSSTKTVTKSFEKADTMQQEHTIVYNDDCLLAKDSLSGSKDGEFFVTKYLYPKDYAGISWIDKLKDMYIIGNPLQIVNMYTSKGNEYVTGSQLIDYNTSGQPTGFYKLKTVKPIPVSEFVLSNQNGFSKTGFYKYKSAEYSRHYNLRMITENEDLMNSTVYLWGYSYMYPVAVIKGITQNQLYNAFSGADNVFAFEALEKPNISAESLYKKLSSIKGAMVTVYTYNPFVGMIECISPNGYKQSYEYDSFMRLKNTSGAWGVEKKYEYNYKK